MKRDLTGQRKLKLAFLYMRETDKQQDGSLQRTPTPERLRLEFLLKIVCRMGLKTKRVLEYLNVSIRLFRIPDSFSQIELADDCFSHTWAYSRTDLLRSG